MADLLAVIAHDVRRPPSSADLEAMVAIRTRLRGQHERREELVAEGVRAVILGDHPSAALGAVREGADWVGWAGATSPEPRPSTDPADCDGQFALIRRRGDETLVAADPFGLKPTFVAERGGLTYISSSALVLASHLHTAPSRAGVERFLRCGMMFGEETLWEGIARLEPAAFLSFDGRSVRRGSYWQPPIDESMRGHPIGTTAEAWIEHSRTAYEPFRNREPWADLTGGFDTRAMTLLARRFGVDFATSTTGGDDDEDVTISAKIAATAGWPWQQIQLPKDLAAKLPELVDYAIGWGDGHLEALSLADVLLGHREKAESSRLLLNGGGGEHLRDYPWAHEFLGAGRSSQVNFDRLIAWRMLGPFDPSLFRSDPTEAVISQIRADLTKRLAPVAAAPNTYQGDLIFAFRGGGHFGAYQAAAGGTLELSLPFYDRESFVAAISAPTEQRRFHRLMREIILQLDPRIAAMPTETGGPAEPIRLGNLPRFAAYPWRRSTKFVARLRGRLSPLSVRSEASPGAALLRAARASFLTDLLATDRLDPRNLRSVAALDPARAKQVLETAAAQPDAADWTMTGRVITVELALASAGAAL